jgi:hypothetical protein
VLVLSPAAPRCPSGIRGGTHRLYNGHKVLVGAFLKAMVLE